MAVSTGSSFSARSFASKYTFRYTRFAFVLWRSTVIFPRFVTATGKSSGACFKSESCSIGMVLTASSLSGVCCQRVSSSACFCSAARFSGVHAAASAANRSASFLAFSAPAVWEGTSTAVTLWLSSKNSSRISPANRSVFRSAASFSSGCSTSSGWAGSPPYSQLSSMVSASIKLRGKPLPSRSRCENAKWL